MIVFLEVTPKWPADAEPILVCSAADPRAQAWDNKRWAAALFDPGSLTVSLFSGEIGQTIDSRAAPVLIAEDELLAMFPEALDVRWESAAYRMWAGDFVQGVSPAYLDYVLRPDEHLSIGDRLTIGGDLLSMSMTIDGSVPGLSVSQVSQGKVSRFEKEGGSIRLSLDPAGAAGDTKVLNREYAGTSGAEGGESLKGTLKPWIFGHAKNVEPVLIDEDNSVYQFSGYGPIESVDALYERGSSFGPALGDYANYAALVTATIPAGRWGTCLAKGLVRLGAPQFGVITGDVKGDNAGGMVRRLPGAILERVAAVRGITALDTESLDALDEFAATLPEGGYMNIVLTEQMTFADLARRICAPYNAQAGFSLMGNLFCARVQVGTPSFTIDAQGRSLPLVGTFVEADTPPPYKRIVMSGDISWRVHSLSNEIAFYADQIERGAYDEAETYREGNIVSLPDGSRWIYVSPTATAGNEPSEDSAFWGRMGPSDRQTFESEEEPTGASEGDLWFKPSTGEMRRWNGTDWGDTLVDLTAAAQIIVVPPVGQKVTRNWEGTPKAGQVPRVLTPGVTRGGVDIRTDDDTTYSVSATGGLDGHVTVNNTEGSADKGKITIADTMTGAGTINLDVAFRGVSQGSFPIKVEVADDAPSGGGGGSAGTISTSISGTSPTAVTGDLNVTVGAGGIVRLSASYEFITDQFSGSQNITAQFYEWNGSAFVAIGSAVPAGSPYTPVIGEPGSGSIYLELTSLTPDDAKKYRLYAWASGGTTSASRAMSGIANISTE